MKISPARAAAFDVLLKIEKERAFSSVLLPAAEERLSPRDRALCHELVLGVLRRKLFLQAYLSGVVKGKGLDPEVMIALEMGLYQLLFLNRVPAYSAIGESVELVKRARKASAKGLVNAVLRKAPPVLPEPDFSDDQHRITVQTSHPTWLIEKWTRDLGPADAERLAKSNNEPSPLCFRFTAAAKAPAKATIEGITRSEWVDGAYFIERPNAVILKMAESGEVYFQDEGSQLVGHAVEVPDGGRFLDVCSAPGSKTTQIAARTLENGKGALITAGDRHWHRVRFLQENCEKQGVRADIVQYDAETALPFAEGLFESVLVDAPCTGTGTIRSNPEIRYFVTPEDLAEIPRKQLAILRNASKVVKRGGRLVYSTCSLEREENEEVCLEFLSSERGFRQVRPDVPERFVTEDGFARTFPPDDGMDGFFIAAFERIVD